MTLTTTQALLIALAVTAGAMLTRFLPFLLFPDNRPVPKIVSYLGRTLPAAMMGLLVVYCLRNVSVVSAPHGLPELISIAVLAALHLWKRNVLLSIGVGTVLYMVLVQVYSRHRRCAARRGCLVVLPLGAARCLKVRYRLRRRAEECRPRRTDYCHSAQGPCRQITRYYACDARLQEYGGQRLDV